MNVMRNAQGIMRTLFTIAVAAAALHGTPQTWADVPVDLANYRSDCGIAVKHEDGRITVSWPMDKGEHGRMVLDLREGMPLIASLGIASSPTGDAVAIVENVEPATFITVGTRNSPPGRPPEMSLFNVFFDTPASRPHQAYRAQFDLRGVRVSSTGRRVMIALGDLFTQPFQGELQFSLYAGARLIHVESVVHTSQDRVAFLYDAGLVGSAPKWQRMAWLDTEGRLRREEARPDAPDRPIAVRHRALVAESASGSLACFPPPHQFFFPRDLTDNLDTAWSGRGHRGLEKRTGFGIRQSETGGGSYVPWFNAPAGTEQRLGVFYLLTRGDANDALQETLRYTHGDHFPVLPGRLTFTSHWHMAIAIAAMQEIARGAGRTMPDFVKMFKDMNVDIIHLGEFHGDGHPQDAGPLRLPEMEAMFAECRRLSDDNILFLPGEEANTHLGLNHPGKHPGHWMCFFPKPVYWTMQRGADQPFVEQDSRYGTVYHIGSRADMTSLLEREHGLAWSAHPRIKASNWTPDIFRNEDFYRADTWLGGAWKAMPADLSRPKLGERVLNLLDDMANWGPHKYVPGEVDVFKLDHTHELYGHMNVNYLQLDLLPRFDEGWMPVLEALRAGHFFVTTGEILIRDYTVAGKPSGASLSVANGSTPEIKLDLDWTFPLRFVELISGDGQKVYRERVELSDTEPFGRRTIALSPELRGRRWVRAEVWDIAANGAFTQPVWIEP
jgi:hypothetical protein